MTQHPALPGFAGTCTFPAMRRVYLGATRADDHLRREPPYPRGVAPADIERCDFTTDYAPEWDRHFKEVHQLTQPTPPPQWVRPNYGRWRGPKVKDDPAKLAEVQRKAAPLRWEEYAVSDGGHGLGNKWFEGQWWCDAYGGSVWVVPLTPVPGNPTLVKIKWREGYGHTPGRWYREGSWSAPNPETAPTPAS